MSTTVDTLADNGILKESQRADIKSLAAKVAATIAAPLSTVEDDIARVILAFPSIPTKEAFCEAAGEALAVIYLRNLCQPHPHPGAPAAKPLTTGDVQARRSW